MIDTFIRKLETFSPLSEEDKCFIVSVTRRSEDIPADLDIIREGDDPDDVRIVETGMAFRYKLLQRGERQIVGFLFPGDICDTHAFLLDRMDHSIATISRSRVVRIARRDIYALLERPTIARALLMVELVNASIVREWLANVGGRRADQRLAHFLCEWHARLWMVGLADCDKCDFALTQAQLGETLGMTSVHLNRSLQSLRADKLIQLRAKRLTIVDAAGLSALGGFKRHYLHARNLT